MTALGPQAQAALAEKPVADGEHPLPGRAGVAEPAPSGVELIARKRAGHAKRGYAAEHDDRHSNGMLGQVAAMIVLGHRDPWGLAVRATDQIDALAVAGSLIAAEIDRLQRLKAKG